MNKPPLVLCFSGHDPGGGAGVGADIETVAALGGHALTVITALTVQDTRNVGKVTPVAPDLMAAQVEALLADSEIDAIKIGLLGAPEQVPVIRETIARTRVPVVLDPVLKAGGGAELASAGLQGALRELLPLTTVLTPNAAEARRLAAGAGALDACGAALLEAGTQHVLITGGDEPGEAVINSWHTAGRAPRRYAWPRLSQTFHGAGCTLAAAIAVMLARGLRPAQALQDAQAYTHRTLANARATGKGRRIPNRVSRDD